MVLADHLLPGMPKVDEVISQPGMDQTDFR